MLLIPKVSILSEQTSILDPDYQIWPYRPNQCKIHFQTFTNAKEEELNSSDNSPLGQ